MAVSSLRRSSRLWKMMKKNSTTVDLPTEAAQETLEVFERYSFPTVKEIAKIIRQKFDKVDRLSEEGDLT